MHPTLRGTFAALLLLSACAQAPEESRFQPVADVPQLMNTVLEPAAETYWDAVGWILDAEGEHEIVPRTAEEWDAVRNAAFVIAESGNLLLMDGRQAPSGEAWAELARPLVDIGRLAISAAERKDRDAVFEIGGDLYQVCTDCHARWAVETLRPSHQAGP